MESHHHDRPRLPIGDWIFAGALLLVPAVIAVRIVFEPRPDPKFILVASFQSPDGQLEFRLLREDVLFGYAPDTARLEIADRRSGRTLHAAAFSPDLDAWSDVEDEFGEFAWENRRAYFRDAPLREVGVE